ncbi:uncharacterized protein ACLA_049100 [Aspergillus clavatus NRRL 1]|uniref:Uncharacterized protein n=1 Tax=Aspergillus clavatus (strain ATCC 1007 / CBS 513.65 / DSM 816 / NCTC 3887 / NRRL 1 / QM 1276 / 107) TaxID=344612 RepID=A1CHT3_ASPCL|nr:uncharacterized protein ACLA_049100 [Aspergillus clavatus NRRL 1]EAW10438.1 conserved hypothetical protein [Aspergillus clavatus NRRL 1]
MSLAEGTPKRGRATLQARSTRQRAIFLSRSNIRLASVQLSCPEKLEFESDIGHTENIGSRLVDDPAHRNNFDLWEQLLRYRQRHYGDRGTLDIWVAVTDRVDSMDLPVVGAQADLFWQSFIDLGLKREVIMRELVDYAHGLWSRTGRRWDKFYESVIGGFLERGMTQQASSWHKKLHHPHLSSPDDIAKVLTPALALSDEPTRIIMASSVKRRPVSPGINAFKNICRLTDGHQIYDHAIGQLLRADRIEDAFSMHTFLIQRQDHPRTYEAIQRLLQCAKENKPRKFFEKLQDYTKERFPAEGELTGDTDSAKSDDTIELSRKVWLEEKPFKDEFGARLFATKALAFETIVAGLRMFGVRAIGPQSLREMAIRVHGSQDLLAKLQELQRAGISIGDTVFARLIRKLASENRDILLSDLLHSDQHPDVLEDAQMQESLLISYYIARDWRPYNMTLAILSEISHDDPQLSNIHFRKFIASGEWASASRVVDDIALNNRALSKESVDFMIKHTLTPRRPGVGPAQGTNSSPTNEVAFVLRVLRRVVPAGTPVSPELWIEMLKRLGMTNEWEELRNCCLWLAQQYSSVEKQRSAMSVVMSLTEEPKIKHADQSRDHGDSVLQNVFDRNMQAAIVAWGFKMRVSPDPNHKGYCALGLEDLVPWVRGLVLLRELEQSGIHLWTNRIQRACRHRLAVLFGQPRQSNRHMNRMLRRENPYDAERVITDINRVWKDPALFDVREDDMYRLINPPSSKMSQRRTRRTLWREACLKGTAFVATK